MHVIMTAPRLAPPAVALIEAAGATLHFMPPYPTAADVQRLAAAVQPVAILSRQGPVTAAVMDAAPSLRIVARHGVGVDDVDIAAAQDRGILVTRAPGSNTQAVAEHTIALLLALAKDLAPLNAQVAAGGWREAATKVRDIAGLRLGLVGYGAIGQAVARLATAFGMDIAAYDPGALLPGALLPGAPSSGIARCDSLMALLARSDAVSLHVPLLPATRHLLGAAGFAAMPPGGYVLNTARGGLLDEAALHDALERGHLAGAALDVFEDEPPAPANPLRRHPRVICTPHVAGVTDDSLVNMGVMAAECIVAVLKGCPVPPDRLVRV